MGFFDNINMLLARSLILITVILGVSLPLYAADWGYEDIDPAPNPVAGSTGHAGNILGIPAATEQTSPIEQWVELFSFVSPTLPLSEETRESIRSTLEKKLEGPKAAEVTGIEKFWPQLQKAVLKNPAQENNYVSLLRALLRMQYRTYMGTTSGDQDIIAQVLGPARIAVPGDPPLTEDAVDAFADMACFLFEQKNPGRTMDATDNRTLFARMVADKYKEAPTVKDKQAVVNFGVDWSRFKILWTDSNEAQRKLLLQKWTGAGSSSIPANPTVLAVMQNGPWSSLIHNTKSGLDAQPKATNAKPNNIRLTGK